MIRHLTGLVLLFSGGAGAMSASAADGWGGSLDLTSDYLVRGITRSDDDPALQADLHYTTPFGLFAGGALSNTRINPRSHWDEELSAFLGYRYAPGGAWSARGLYNHYAYPWNGAGTGYDYDELQAQLAYEGWLQLDLSYSPNYGRHVRGSYRALTSVSQTSLEVSAQRPVWGRLSADGGVGYAYLGGPDGTGYVYLSVGLSYDIGPCALWLAYVNTSSAAKYLFGQDAASNQVVGTVLWRF